jgi:hypothetical protein
MPICISLLTSIIIYVYNTNINVYINICISISIYQVHSDFRPHHEMNMSIYLSILYNGFIKLV